LLTAFLELESAVRTGQRFGSSDWLDDSRDITQDRLRRLVEWNDDFEVADEAS